MPEIMYVADQSSLDIISMDNVLQGVTFLRDKIFTTGLPGGDCSKRVCYVIYYTNAMDIPKATNIKVSI